jgi:TBC1 domain family protein 5
MYRRWIRLLFGREFHIEDVLVIWDAIFADSGAFEPDQFELSLVEHIAITMLIYIREQCKMNEKNIH